MPDRADKQQVGALGFTRSPSEDDPRRDPRLLASIARVAPGTELRQGIEDIIRSHEGALIVIGDPEALAFLYSGGMRLDINFTAQQLYELSKMDGAIIVKDNLTKLAYANVQLMPDPTISSNETGTRHRTAERVAKQTGALVVSISQQRETVTIFQGRQRYQLDPVPTVLAKTNQALATLGHVPHAPRAGAHAADGTRVPERSRSRRRPRRTAARRADDAHGRGDRAQLRRARLGGPPDPDAPRPSCSATSPARRRPWSTTTTPQAPGPRRCWRRKASRRSATTSCSSSSGSRRSSATRATINPLDHSGVAPRLPGAVEHPAPSAERGPEGRGRHGRPRRDRPRLPARPRSGAGRGHRAGSRHPRGAPSAPGAQPRRPLPAALARYEQGLCRKVADLRDF